MIRLTQLLGQPTISLSDAERTGKVQGVRIEDGRVVAVHTGDGLVEASAIRSFDGDAITHDGVPALVDQKADSPLGRRILDEAGDELGRLADLEIEPDGVVTVVAIDDGRTLVGSTLRAIGSYAVIVAARPDTTPTGDLPPPPPGSAPT